MNFEKSIYASKRIVHEKPIPSGKIDNVSIAHLDLEMFSEEGSRIDELVKLKGQNNWEKVRAESNFTLVEREYSFGKRKVYVPKELDNNINLQSSRGIHVAEDETLEKTLKRFVQSEAKIFEPDKLRIQEINTIIEAIRGNFGDFLEQLPDQKDMDSVILAMTAPGSKFIEIGFRVPSLMNYWQNNGFSTSFGYDINPLNISICKKLGWNVGLGDLNTGKGFEAANFSDAGLVVAYHVLEHVHDPLSSLEMLSKMMKPGTMFHIEVPIEPGIPKLKVGHLFPFENGDLQAMLIDSGFIPLSYSNKTHPGGPNIERVLAVLR